MGFSRRFGHRIGGFVQSAFAVLALAAAAHATPAHAQAPGGTGAPGPACSQLEASLAALDRGANSWASRQAKAAQQRSELQKLTGQAQSMGCDAPRGFLIFQGPPRPPQCDQIDDQISRLRSSVAGLEQGGSSQAGQRRALILALAQNNCGAQYSAAVRRGAPAQPQRPRNFLEAIFGAPVQNDPEESAPDVDIYAVEPAKPSYSSRTVCVRTCDGYFFPLARSSSQDQLASQDVLCKRLCPAAETELFTYSGEDIRSAVSLSGQSYMSMPNALRYRKEVVPSCACRAPGQSWAQALAGIENENTLRKGDILVTEEQAKEMSQPKLPSTGKDLAASTPAPTGTTATAAAPLAPASEQPGQRRVRIIPLPRSPNAQPDSSSSDSSSASSGASTTP